MNARTLTYALILGFIATAPLARAIDPIDHQPIPDLVAALKNNGQARIAQGSEDIIAKDTQTGELFTTRSILILTRNNETNEWTISVIHDKVFGSTMLIGANLKKVSEGNAINLPTFDRVKAVAAAPMLKGWNATYYPEEVQRLKKLGLSRLFTGQINVTVEQGLKGAMTPAFADILLAPNSDFVVLVADQYGTCVTFAGGTLFSEKH